MNTSPYREEAGQIAAREFFKLDPAAAAILLKKYQQRRAGQPRNERDEMLDLFVAKLNAGNLADNYPKTTHARVAKQLEGIPTGDLHAFYRKCEGFKKFGAGFRYELKPRV